MKIGFYKPHWPIKFLNDNDDMDAISYEVVNVMKIFAERGHDCRILSENDLDANGAVLYSGQLIHPGSMKEKYDRIFLFGGPFHLEPNRNLIPDLKKLTPILDFILTDTRCMPPYESDLDYFDTFYSQCTEDTYLGMPNVYGGVAEFRCYNMELVEPTEELIRNKGVNLYFGGTTRNRLKKYERYIWEHRDSWAITGESKPLSFNNRVSRDLYLELLKQTKFSLVFCDVDYEKNNFITPRHYEYIEANIVSFCDIDWDKGEHIMKIDDWQRVDNYYAMQRKINHLLQNPLMHLEILKKQKNSIPKSYINGDYVYRRLKK